ncbi:MAG: hypothetical protein EOL97_08715 [Spirochaetia bacterium]|nr:hypothetical protein [Spirochaetia bacterium]
MVHLVYCDNQGKKGSREIDKIIDGSKKMIIRSAAGRKVPHSRVFKDEVLYFIEKGTKIINLKATVKEVQNFTKLSDTEITNIIDLNQNMLNLNDKQKKRWQKKCICLIEFSNVEKIHDLNFEHQGNMDDWLILDKIEDVLVGSSSPYTYKSKLV